MRAVQVFAICAMATMGTTASAQEIDWNKVDEALGRTAAVSGDVHRYGFPRSDLQVSDPRRRHHQAVIGARRLDCIQADARRRDGNGRSCPAGGRSKPGYGQADRERPRSDRGP